MVIILLGHAYSQYLLLLADVFGESQFLAYTSFGYSTIYSSTGRDTRKLFVCVLTSFAMLDCTLLRTAILSKRYCARVLSKNFNILYIIMCSVVCTFSGVFHNILIIIIMMMIIIRIRIRVRIRIRITNRNALRMLERIHVVTVLHANRAFPVSIL